MINHITEKEVEDKVEMKNIISNVEEAFHSYYKGESKMVDKNYLKVPKGDFRAMPALVNIDDFNYAGVKWVNVHPEHNPTVQATIILCDPESGTPKYFIEATELTAMRTGAAAAIATKYLTPKNSNILGIVGAGYQATKQIEAIRCVRDIDTVYINDISEERCINLANSLDDIETRIVSKETIGQADIVCSVTPSQKPILNNNHLEKVKHINAMGADSSEKQEYESEVINDSIVVVDDLSQAKHSGEISSHKNIIKDKRLYSIGEIIDLSKSGNLDKSLVSERTIFDSTGLGIQDIVSCKSVI